MDNTVYYPVEGNATSQVIVTNVYTAGGLDISKTVDVARGNAIQAKGKDFTFTVKRCEDRTKETELTIVVYNAYEQDHYSYIIGYPDGTVKSENNVVRSEVATIFFRLMTNEYRAEKWSATNSFSDVQSQHWFNNAISTLENAGIVKGYL